MGEQVLYQVLLWLEAEVPDTFYICLLVQPSQALLGTGYPHFTELASVG